MKERLPPRAPESIVLQGIEGLSGACSECRVRCNQSYGQERIFSPNRRRTDCIELCESARSFCSNDCQRPQT
jgi:hypothetical protein